MKKVFAIFTIVSLMATAACGNKEVSSDSEEIIEVIVEETEEITEETTDSAAVMVEEVVEVIEEVK